jgi:hypothetical protein
MMRRAFSLVLAALLTGAALWLLVTPEIAAQLRATAHNANHAGLLAAIALSAAVQWLRAWRFAIMTNGRAALPEPKLVGIAFQLNFLTSPSPSGSAS